MKKTQPHQYYHQRIKKTFSFIIPPNKKILFLGSNGSQILASLRSSKSVNIKTDYQNYIPKEKFDYIILNGILGQSTDMMQVLKNLIPACSLHTKIIIYQYNYLWQSILNLVEKLNFKKQEAIQNWFSVNDLKTYLHGANFQVTRVFRKTLFPLDFFSIGKIINFLGVLIPFFDFFKLDQFIIARPEPQLFPKKPSKSLTICITVRNEKGNIEPIVKSIPKVCASQEILFIEGHSTDGTKQEILKMKKKYSQKNVRVMGQPGIGQGDATRVGFKAAKGDIIIIYEGD